MTVVVYDAKLRTMASDSLCSSGGYYVTKTKKLFKLPSGAIVGTAGDDDCRSMLGLLADCETAHDLPSRLDLAAQRTDFMGLLVLPNNSVFEIGAMQDYSSHANDPWVGWVSEISERFTAIGHGADFALPILHAGGTLADAVRMACKFSLFCGPPVQTLKLELKPKEKKKTKKEEFIITEPVEVDNG